VAQRVEHLPSECKALSSDPITPKKKKKQVEQKNLTKEYTLNPLNLRDTK
jgi:hypothetical protein